MWNSLKPVNGSKTRLISRGGDSCRAESSKWDEYHQNPNNIFRSLLGEPKLLEFYELSHLMGQLWGAEETHKMTSVNICSVYPIN